ncbi:MAG TPA: ParB N-terminal domain-containing protein [Phycisphaerae bacterium]|jgi:ParB family chromosome partitioning protein|nr:ParB N-terminal domain-containing protein [Phycisphaerae bacterium]HPP28635.1 ParB N-terminal domain-containing protein [Phycisphaerae bacterium]
MDHIEIRSMAERQYRMIPVNQINVVNSRGREKKQFQENVRSISEVGLYKPILVNRRNLDATGQYDLICGEGRLLAHIELGKTHIAADVWDIDERQAHLMTLGENIARTPPQTIEFARALKEMRDYGMGWKELSAITGKTEEYIRNYVRLIEQGEERLVKGVEDGVFSLNFAMNVAQSNDRSIQHLLMDAFDSGIVNSNNLPRVRKIIEDRLEKGKTLGSRRSNTTYTVDKLKRDIRKITREKEAFVYEAGQRENRLMRILVALQRLRKDGSFLAMLKTAGLAEPPQLKGQYAV